MDKQGFSLIELIIVLVIASILATGMAMFLQTAYFKSSSPVKTLQDSITLQNVIENITVDYIANYKGNLKILKTKIGAEGSDKSNNYGAYRVHTNRYIQFDSTTNVEENDTSGDNNLLKVTLVRIGDRNQAAEFITIIYDLQKKLLAEYEIIPKQKIIPKQ